MQSKNIHLPGLGQHKAMFAFDQTTPKSARLMNLTPLSNSPTSEQWLAPGPIAISETDHIRTVTTPHYQLRTLIVAAPPVQMRQIARDAYDNLLADIALSNHPQLARFWNYVPQINLGAGDSEVYRQFCWGRAEAFEAHQVALPAATAIGSQDNMLRITALSTDRDTRVLHAENPRQLSAYKYPKEYGPRSPSFARATWVERDKADLLLLSGTSSIVSHNTLHSGNLEAQVAETKRNIDHLLQNLPRQIGLVEQPFTPLAMRFYLRDAAAYAAAEQAYNRCFAGYPDAQFFVADICRRDLSMEVEGVFSSNKPS